MMRRLLIALLLVVPAACSLTRGARNPSAAAASSEAAPADAAAAANAPAPPAPTRQYRLGGAASALVTQGHTRAAAGDYPAATATLERALRIEPENPLTWIELGRVQLAAGNAAQADNMGHKALALASGDPSAQAAAWRLISDALRVRGRNEEAATAGARADTLAPH
jgi:tetratricopeptide (TPR) repeat protein